MNTTISYDDEELELLNFVENQTPDSIPNLPQELSQLKNAVKVKHSKRKSISLRLLENDLEKIKTEAIKVGLPYQTLISSIVHQYVNGQFSGK